LSAPRCCSWPCAVCGGCDLLLKRGLIALAALLAVGIGILLTLPTEEACRASGRAVDPTHRHCVAGASSVELRELNLGHATDPIVCIPTTLLVGLGLWFAARPDHRRMPERSA
jgi:hypothetical protein